MKYIAYEIVEIDLLGQKYTVLKEADTQKNRWYESVEEAEKDLEVKLKHRIFVVMPYINTN